MYGVICSPLTIGSHLRAHEPGKALSFYLRLRDTRAYSLIKEHSLFTDVTDQALLLVKLDGEDPAQPPGEGVRILAENAFAIPVCRLHTNWRPCVG